MPYLLDGKDPGAQAEATRLLRKYVAPAVCDCFAVVAPGTADFRGCLFYLFDIHSRYGEDVGLAGALMDVEREHPFLCAFVEKVAQYCRSSQTGPTLQICGSSEVAPQGTACSARQKMQICSRDMSK